MISGKAIKNIISMNYSTRNDRTNEHPGKPVNSYVKFLVSILIFFCIPITLFPEANSPQDHFIRGMELIENDPIEGQRAFEQAALEWTNMLDIHPETGYLHYNIGNAWFMNGNYPKAVIHYLQAKRFLINDSQLEHNLQQARNKIPGYKTSEEKDNLRKILLFWHDLTPVFLKFIILLLSLAGIWAIIILRIIRGRFFSGILVTVLVIFLLFAGSISVDYYNSIGKVHGVITAESYLKRGDHHGYENVLNSEIPAGTEFVLIEERQGWLKIRLTDNNSGWVPEGACVIIE